MDVGIYEKDSPPTDVTIVDQANATEQKLTAHVYRIVGELQDSPIPGQFMATYQYQGDYHDIPYTLVTHILRRNT